jgi:hypothetical protein
MRAFVRAPCGDATGTIPIITSHFVQCSRLLSVPSSSARPLTCIGNLGCRWEFPPEDAVEIMYFLDMAEAEL